MSGRSSPVRPKPTTTGSGGLYRKNNSSNNRRHSSRPRVSTIWYSATSSTTRTMTNHTRPASSSSPPVSNEEREKAYSDRIHDISFPTVAPQQQEFNDKHHAVLTMTTAESSSVDDSLDQQHQHHDDDNEEDDNDNEEVRVTFPPVLPSRNKGQQAAELKPSASSSSSSSNPKTIVKRTSSSFMRASDLQLCKSLACKADQLLQAGLHQEAAEVMEEEIWIAIDGDGSEEIIPHVTNEMVRLSLDLVNDLTMWTPADKKTAKVVANQNRSAKGTGGCTSWLVQHEKEVLLWTGKLHHGKYGADIPCVLSRGIVNMTPLALAELLLDSSRVQSYNKMSQGRSDEVVLQTGLGTVNGTYGCGETKVIRSVNKPPVIRSVLEFVSVLHGRELDPAKGEGEGYIVVGRSVSRSTTDSLTNERHQHTGNTNTNKNEILLNVHLMRPVRVGSEVKSEMININHLKSPFVPMFVAKKLGLMSAGNFINDIRALC